MGSLFLAIIITMTLVVMISVIVYRFIKIGEKDDGNNKFFTIENILISIGVLFIVCAASLPFIILAKFNFEFNKIKLEDFDKLGPVGDYLGGTTVGLLSLASLIFVSAAMMMQKKELSLQRNEVMATRKEYEITNKTMKKQSFDSTYFNMINLHQSILNQVSINESNGREAFEKMYVTFKKFVQSKNYEITNEILFEELYGHDRRMSLITDTFVSNEIAEKIRSAFKNFFYEEINHIYRYYDDDDEYKIYLEQLKFLIEGLLENFESNKHYITEEHSLVIFRTLANEGLLFNENINLTRLTNQTINNLPNNHKKKLYEDFYNNNENMIGHYYRNLYRIVKYIREYDFSSSTKEDEDVNNKEQKEYMGILRAQLSSYELLMLFYNICYSDKGEKFKFLLKSTNFFDNHLVEDDFLWENDIDQLEYFKI